MEIGQIIAIAIVVIVLGFMAFWEIKKNGLKETALKLILEAEENMQNGDEKMAYVIEKLMSLIPMPLQLFITENMIKALIQKVFDNVKPLLDYKGSEE